MNQPSKTELRTDLKTKCRTSTGADKSAQSLAISQKLYELMKNKKGIWGGFVPMDEEPQIFPLPELPGLRWAYPRIEETKMSFHETEYFEEGPFGIENAVDENLIERDQIQGFIIPGLGFSRDGHRLGWGKGYYDRYLTGYKGETLGVCFNFQMLSTAAWAEAHDLKVARIVTAQEVIQCEEKSWK